MVALGLVFFTWFRDDGMLSEILYCLCISRGKIGLNTCWNSFVAWYVLRISFMVESGFNFHILYHFSFSWELLSTEHLSSHKSWWFKPVLYLLFFLFSFVDGRQVTEYFGSKACQVKWQRLNRCVIRQSVKNTICHNLVCPRFWYRSSTIIYVQGWYWDSLYIPLLHGRWWSLYTRLYNWLGWWLNVWLFAHHCFTSASEESLRVSFLTLSSINIIFNSSLFAACFVAN